MLSISTCCNFCHLVKSQHIKPFQSFPKRQILDSSKLKQFADDNFNLMKMAQNSSKWIENIVGKREIARYEQFLLFPQCFQKVCTADT